MERGPLGLARALPAAVPPGTATPVGETVGVASRYTFGTVLVWAALIAFVLYVLYRRFG